MEYQTQQQKHYGFLVLLILPCTVLMVYILISADSGEIPVTSSIPIPILERTLNYCGHILLPILCCCCLVWIVFQCSVRRRMDRWELFQFKEVQGELQEVMDHHYSSQEGCYRAESCAICEISFVSIASGSESTCSGGNEETESIATEQSALLEKERVELDANTLMSLRCGHEFHSACILQWMADQKRNYEPCRCPVCMQGI